MISIPCNPVCTVEYLFCFAGFLLTGAGGGGFFFAITKEAKFSEKVPELIKGLGVSIFLYSNHVYPNHLEKRVSTKVEKYGNVRFP
jgi:mevalonate kinase